MNKVLRVYIIDADLIDGRIAELEKEISNPEFTTSMKYVCILLKAELEYLLCDAEEKIMTFPLQENEY